MVTLYFPICIFCKFTELFLLIAKLSFVYSILGAGAGDLGPVFPFALFDGPLCDFQFPY